MMPAGTAPGHEAPAVPAQPGAGLAHRRALAGAWALAVLSLFLLRLGAAPLFDVDEGAFAEATREMVASGDLGFPTLEGAPRYDKPILVYWLQAASVRLLGLGELALRLPSALCAFGWCLAVAGFAARRWGIRAGLLAGTVLATSAGPLLIGRAATADALLDLLLTLSLLDVWRHLETGRPAPLRRAYALAGLGLLAKGPIALVVPAAVSFLHLAAARDLRRWLRAGLDPWGWALLLAIAGPWYAYALHRHGMDFVRGFLVHHNLDRYTSVLEGHRGSLLYYLLMLPVMLLPWSALLPSVLARARALWREPLDRYLVLWGAFVVAFFSLSGTKLPHYVLYGSTPAFLLIARTAPGAGRAARAAGLGLVLLLLVALAALPLLAPVVAPAVRDPLYRALLSVPASGAGVALTAGALLLAAAWLGACRALRAFPVRMALGAAAVAVAVTALGTPWLADVLQGPVKRAAAVARARPERAVQWRVRVPSFSLYRGAAAPRATPAPGELAITRDQGLPAGTQVLHRERGYALVLLPPG
jgi:4-amino-4-deoxy-L-arabinose transferase-like glycosyltransferase